MSSEDSSKTVPRDQIETALEYLELSHGMYLKTERPQKAYAYYDAIGMVQAAMNEELRPPEDVHNSESAQEYIERSREARKKGVEAATLFDQRYPSSDEEPRGLFSEVMARVRGLF